MNALNLLFDMDGCLINSLEVQRASYYGSYAEIVGDDKCPDFSEYLKYTGDSLPNIFEKLGLPIAMVEPYRRISSNAIDRIQVNYPLINLIRQMRKNGSKVAICTGKDHKRTCDILKHYSIDDCFDVVVASDDILEPKPSPMSINVALQRLSVDKSSCIFIGDGYNDILCAKNAKVKVVLALWYGDEGVPHEADYIAESVDELSEIFKSIQM